MGAFKNLLQLVNTWAKTQLFPNHYTDSVTIADDAVAVIPIPDGAGVCHIEFTYTGGNSIYGAAMCEQLGASGSANQTQTSSGLVTYSSGALTGTTGVDGDFTVSAHTDGNIYLENRTNVSREIVYSLRNAK